MLQIGRSLVRSQMVSLEFFIDIKSFRSHYGPGVDSASNRNEYYQGYFLGVKAAGAWGWQPYHHSVQLSWNLGTLTSWNPLGHSRSVKGLIYLSLYPLPFINWLTFAKNKTNLELTNSNWFSEIIASRKLRRLASLMILKFRQNILSPWIMVDQLDDTCFIIYCSTCFRR